MKESYRIEIQVTAATLKRLEHAIAKVTDYEKQDKAFILQIYKDGHAKGLALCSEHAEALKKALLPYWDGAKDLRY